MWNSLCRRIVPFSNEICFKNLTKSFVFKERCFFTFTRLYKDNRRRPRVAASGTTRDSEKSKSRNEATRELAAATNRTKWEQERNLLKSLSGRIPTDPVYLTSEFEPKTYNLAEAVYCLREAAHPDMFDCLENAVNLKLTVNMCTKKKTRFISKFEAHVVFPHLLDFLPKRRILALCKESDDPNECLKEGALDAGGEELISRIEHGAFHWEEYDNVVAHTDWESRVFKLRHVLKDRLPTSKNGRLGENVPGLVSSYANGISIASTPLHGVPEINFINIIIGQLSWDIDRLEANFHCLIETCKLQKSSRLEGDLFDSGELFCPPTGERFLLDKSYFQSDLVATNTLPADMDEDEQQSMDQEAVSESAKV